MSLKLIQLSKPQFAFLIAVVNTVMVLISAAVSDFYPMDPTGTGIVVLVTIIGNALIAFLTTEEASAPGTTPPPITQQFKRSYGGLALEAAGRIVRTLVVREPKIS